eukprot:scpid74062/ scgid5569/ Battenin; Protein CLN3
MIELRSLTPREEDVDIDSELSDESAELDMGAGNKSDYVPLEESEDEADGRAVSCTIRCNECKSKNSFRVHVAFWLLGLCNNFGYVIMLSGAHDILLDETGDHSGEGSNSTTTLPPTSSTGYPITTSNSTNTTAAECNRLDCNKESTATILLADVLPSLLIKITAPYFMHLIPFHLRIFLCVACGISSYVLVAFAHVIALSYLGVVFASIGSGLGEITFLSLTSHYPSTTVSYWSSGTGAAGAVGAWAYALLRQGLSSRDTLLVCNVIPVLMAITYWGILPKPTSVVKYDVSDALLDENSDPNGASDNEANEGDAIFSDPSQPQTSGRRKKLKPPGASAKMTLREKLMLLPPLLKYMIPLFFVYYAEYLINQGLYELMIWRSCIFIDPGEQYRWFQATYQFGVFISRSSSQILPINPIWLLSTLQLVNLGVLFIEVDKHIFPNIYIPFAFTFYEGLLGGACYANAFTRIHREVAPAQQEFSLGAASVADSLGIAVAGVTALPIHSHYCSMWARK